MTDQLPPTDWRTHAEDRYVHDLQAEHHQAQSDLRQIQDVLNPPSEPISPYRLPDQVRALKIEAEELRTNNRHADAANTDYNTRHNRLSDQFDEAIKGWGETNQDLARVRRERDHAKERIATLHRQRNDARQEAKEAEETNAHIRIERNAAWRDRESAHKQRDRLRGERDEARRELARRQATIDRLRKERDGRKAKCAIRKCDQDDANLTTNA